MSDRNRLISAAVVAIALTAFIPMARAEFVAAAANLSADAREDRDDFNQIFNQTAGAHLLEGAFQNSNSLTIDLAGGIADPSATGVSKLFLDHEHAVHTDEIRVPDSLRIRGSGANAFGGAFGETTAGYSLLADDLSLTGQTRELGWSGHGYEYHAFAAEYQRLSGLEAVTLVPTPTALKSGVLGLLIVMGITAYIRRRARMKARQRTG